MRCPQCGARTEVSETRGPFRDRRCTDAACLLEFTTREHIMTPREQVMKPRQHGRLCARTRATKIEVPPAPPAAGVKVDPTSRPGPGAPTNSVEVASGVQEKPPCWQREVAA
jgi:hypothetical protein